MEMKKTLKFFTIADYEKEQDYLRQMHNSGWKFRKVSGLCMYHFEKCLPEDVVYQLDYNRDGIEHREEYVKMFSDCGWEYLQDYMGYSYFRKPVSQSAGEEIFCDDSSRLQMLERVFRGRVIPLLILFFCALLPGLFVSVSYGSGVITMIYCILIAVYLMVFGVFAYKYWGLKNKR